MFKFIFSALAMAVFFGAVTGNSFASEAAQERLASSRAAVKQFFGALKGELVTGIKAGGPTHALGICNSRAPAITDDASQKNGWRIARTSLKVRNPANQPDDWERTVLESFDARRAAGEDPAKMEHFEIVEQSGNRVFRYMKAIPTAAKPCLACHGSKVSPEVEAKLSELYPDDLARGYSAGDIRGAFTITQPMD